MAIHELPAQVANQIAAGEVVERPSAVVKELVENAFDAKATRVIVDIERAGSSKILVRDNGCGIYKDELALALKRHATSKISSIDDLNNIMSMGFRGEALASIAAVSRLVLTSKPKNQELAYSVSVEGIGQIPQISPASHPDGTTIEIRDLFFNTPARRRFLRSEKTEFMQIEEMFKRLALSRKDVALVLKHNGKTVYDLKEASAEELYKKRLATIMGKSFFSEIATIDTNLNSLSMNGYLSLVEEKLPTQYFFVNNRVVKDKTIVHAIKEAYKQILDHQGNVSYVCFLTLPPYEVDINVHPQKYEVRFQENRVVHDFIQNSVINALRRIEQVLPEEFVETINPNTGHNYGSFKIIEAKDEVKNDFFKELDKNISDQSSKSLNEEYIDKTYDKQNNETYDKENNKTNNIYSVMFGNRRNLEIKNTQISRKNFEASKSFLDNMVNFSPKSDFDEQEKNNTYTNMYTNTNTTTNTSIRSKEFISNEKINIEPWLYEIYPIDGTVKIFFITGHYSFLEVDNLYYAVDLLEISKILYREQFFKLFISENYLENSELISEMNVSLLNIEKYISKLENLGFKFGKIEKKVYLYSVPKILRNNNIIVVLQELCSKLNLDIDYTDRQLTTILVDVLCEQKLPSYYSSDMVQRLFPTSKLFCEYIKEYNHAIKEINWSQVIKDIFV
ncbi:MAG: DNA mismatch repair endonuclease MutL [Succinivibrionaceae bacterium]